MNKKLFLGMFAAVGMLFATSCSNDELDGVQSGNEATVSFTLGVEGGVQTRAISDGSGAKELHYRVFNEDGTPVSNALAKKVETVDSYPYEVKLTLAKGQTYKVAFFAKNAECDAYTVDDNMNLTINYAGANNDEKRDAFFKTVDLTVTGNTSETVELKRPFAQLNVGVTDADWEAAVASGVTVARSKVEITNVASTMNLVNGTVGNETNLIYSLADIPTQKLTVNGTDYNYLSMCYFLVNAAPEGTEKASLNQVKFTFKSGKKDIVLEDGLNNVPVQRNWRTNIFGQLLTGTINFNIVIDNKFDGEFNGNEAEIAEGVSYDSATKTFTISNKEGLKWIAEQSNAATKHELIQKRDEGGYFAGQTVKLAQNIDLSGERWTPIGSTWANGFVGTFDGNGNTISNLTVDHVENSGLFGNVTGDGTVKNVQLSDVTVTGNSKAGALVANAYGTITNCHVDGGSVTSTVVDGDNANNVGGLIGYLGEQSNSAVTESSVKNLNVMAYRDLGGLVGTAQTGTSVTDNMVYNVKVIANQLPTYNEEKPANADEVVGRDLGATVSNNTENNVTVCVIKGQNNMIKVSTADDLKAVAAFVDAGNSCQGLTVSIENDIDLKDKVWTPIGENKTFQGSIDGNNNTIKNLKGVRGLINKMGSGSTSPEVAVKNLTLENVEITNSTGSRIAAFVGDGRYCTPLTLENLTLKGKVTISGSTQIAGIYAASDRQVVARNIKVEVTEDSYIECTDPGDYWAYTGGVFGRLNTATLENIESNIDVKAISNNGIGGIVGRCMNVKGEDINCTGDVIVSQADESVNFTNAEGTVIYAYQGIGKIIGYHGQDTYTNCKSTGKLTIGDKDSNGLIYTNTDGETVSDSRFGSCHSDRGWTDKVITIVD